MFGVILSFIATHMLYLALHLESGSFPRPLSPKEEAAAFAAWKAGDTEARDRLIRHNLRLVAHIVKKYYSSGCDHDDLISIGTIGLIKAVNSFDDRKGARFSTYAARCIENEVLMRLRAGKKDQNLVSINEPIESDRDGNSLTLNDVVADPAVMEEGCEDREETVRLRRLVDTLSGRERQIIVLRYGLSGQPPLTQQQTAALLGISRSYISRLDTMALAVLREGFQREDGRAEPCAPGARRSPPPHGPAGSGAGEKPPQRC